MAGSEVAQKKSSNFIEKFGREISIEKAAIARIFYRTGRHFAQDTSSIDGKLAATHLKSSDSWIGRSWDKWAMHMNKAMDCPPECCSKETIEEIIHKFGCMKSFLLEPGAIIPFKHAQTVFSLCGRAIRYAPAEKQAEMKEDIINICRELAKVNYYTIFVHSTPKDLSAAFFLGIACGYANRDEKKALENELMAAFLNVARGNDVTASYGKKERFQNQNWLVYRAESDLMGSIPFQCIENILKAGIPESKLESFRYEVARIFAEKVGKNVKDRYYVMLERTTDAISWLPSDGENGVPTHEILARTYLNKSRSKEMLAAALMLRIAMTFNCTQQTRDEIQKEFAAIRSALHAIKSNSHNWINGGPTLRGRFAGALADNYDKEFNSLMNLGNLLLKYRADPKYLIYIEKDDC